MCVQIGLRYPDMHNLPIFSDYVKFLRLASLRTLMMYHLFEIRKSSSGFLEEEEGEEVLNFHFT